MLKKLNILFFERNPNLKFVALHKNKKEALYYIDKNKTSDGIIFLAIREMNAWTTFVNIQIKSNSRLKKLVFGFNVKNDKFNKEASQKWRHVLNAVVGNSFGFAGHIRGK